MFDLFRARLAGALRRAAAQIDGGDNTGVISPPASSADHAPDEAANDWVPFQDPVTPEAADLLGGRCPHGMLRTGGCVACAYEAKHGLGAQAPPPVPDAMPADEYFAPDPGQITTTCRRVFRP